MISKARRGIMARTVDAISNVLGVGAAKEECCSGTWCGWVFYTKKEETDEFCDNETGCWKCDDKPGCSCCDWYYWECSLDPEPTGFCVQLTTDKTGGPCVAAPVEDLVR